MTAVPALPFHDGNSVPQLGYGVWQVEDEVAADVVRQAIDAGYRHIDTAAGYQNEGGVGRAVKASDVPREDLFITTKLANEDQGFDSAKAALDVSLEKLDTDYVDLYLIHWASPQRGKYLESWKALIELQQEGKAKSIGVSNFPIPQLEEIIAETGVVPVMHQSELHPEFQQSELRRYHAEKGILTEAWSPLGQGGDILKDPVITAIAETHGVDAGQMRGTIDSFAVNTRVGRTKQFIVRTGVDATPTVIVNGRYRVRGRSFEDILRITDQLIVRERNAARAGDAG